MALFLGVSCSDDPDTLPMNPYGTLGIIEKAKTAVDAVTVGGGIGQYLPSDKDAMMTKISGAIDATHKAATVEELDNIGRQITTEKNNFLLLISVENTTLESLITDATALNADTPVGDETGMTTQANKDALATAIAAAQTVSDQTRITQKELNGARVALNTAMVTFEEGVVAIIDEENMVLYLKLDGNAVDETGLNTCVLGKNGGAGYWAASAILPTAVADHKGEAGKALHFARGAYVKIPSQEHFLGDEISITVWFSVDNYRPTGEVQPAGDAVQYLLAQDIWNGMQLNPCVYGEYARNDEGSFSMQRAGNNSMNMWENAQTVPLADRLWNVKSNQWRHLGVTFSPQKSQIYLDGKLVKEAAVTGFVPYKDKVAQSTLDAPLFIGIPGPGEEYDPGDGGNGWATCLWGSVNDMRIFKKELSDKEVRHIYNTEK